MTSLFTGPQAAYLVVAVIVLALAIGGMVWIGRVIRGELGAPQRPAVTGQPGSIADNLPQALVKEAVARGLVTPAQLTMMSPAERTFLFASMQKKGAPAGAAASVVSPTPLVGAPHVAPAVAPEPAAAPIAVPVPADIPPGMLAILNAEKPRAFCANCGTELQLPVFPPLVARCAQCGMKSAIRKDEGERLVVILSPPPRL